MSRDLKDLDPQVQVLAQDLLDACSEHKITLGIVETYRSYEEQAAIYAQGRTSPGAIVSYAPPGYSFHQFGLAVDFDILSFPGDLTPKNVWDGPWEYIGELGELCGLDWGGRWKHPDRPHFQYSAGRTLAELRTMYPKGHSGKDGSSLGDYA